MKRRRCRPRWAVGVDLGNVYSAVAVIAERGHEPIPDRYGNDLLQSVAVSSETGVLVGEPAARLARNRPDMLQRFRQEPSDEATQIVPRGKNHISCDVAALLLRELKDNAETHLHGHVTDVVVAVPNDCGITDRQTILQAVEQAGLTTIRLIPAGAAAALHFAATQPCPEGRVLTIDVGSSLKISLLNLSWPQDGAPPQIRVVGGSSADHLGGSQWNRRIASHLAQQCRSECNIDVGADPRDFANLQDLSESAKRSLCQTDHWFGALVLNCGRCVEVELDADTLDGLTQDLATEFADEVNRLLVKLQLAPHDIDLVLPLGGMSRMPSIRRVLSEVVPADHLMWNIDPKLSVAGGAAVLAQHLMLERHHVDRCVQDGDPCLPNPVICPVLPRSIGIPSYRDDRTPSVATVVAAGTPLPWSGEFAMRAIHQNQGELTVRLCEASIPYSTELSAEEWTDVAEATFADLTPTMFDGEFVISLTMDIDACPSVECESSITTQRLTSHLRRVQ